MGSPCPGGFIVAVVGVDCISRTHPDLKAPLAVIVSSWHRLHLGNIMASRTTCWGSELARICNRAVCHQCYCPSCCECGRLCCSQPLGIHTHADTSEARHSHDHSYSVQPLAPRIEGVDALSVANQLRTLPKSTLVEGGKRGGEGSHHAVGESWAIEKGLNPSFPDPHVPDTGGSGDDDAALDHRHRAPQTGRAQQHTLLKTTQ